MEIVPAEQKILGVAVSESVAVLNDCAVGTGGGRPKEIKIEAQFRPEIFLEQNFELSGQEIVNQIAQIESVENKMDARQQKIARLFFVMRVSVKEIAESMKISKETIYNDLKDYREDLLKSIKKDLRANKKILGYMVELMVQMDYQTRVIWDKYNQLEADSMVIRAGLRDAYEKRKADAKADVGPLSEHIEAARTSLSIHDRQQGYLSLLRQQTLATLQILDRFGLCGDEAVKLIMSGGIDVDVKIKEVRTTLIKLVKIIKEEISDKKSQQQIFGRLANEINPDGLADRESI